MATETKERVKTYRVLRDGMRVGYSIRNFGDFMPEAPSLPTFRTLLNTNLIDEVWVDQEEYDEWEKRQAKADKELARSQDSDDSEDEEFPESDDADDTPSEKPKPKKRVAKKRPAKKTAAKKSVKKGKSNDRAAKRIDGKPV